MVPVSAKHFFPFLRPAGFLAQPIATEELTDTSVIRLFLGRFQGDKTVEVLVNGRRLTRAAVRGLRWAVP